MRDVMITILIGACLSLPAVVFAERQALSDAELDQITAGADVCALFGISGPCVVSYNEVFDQRTQSPGPL